MVAWDLRSSERGRVGRGLLLKTHPKRVRVVAVYVDLFHQGERPFKPPAHELFNVLRRSRLLPTKLVARERHHREAARAQRVLQLLKALVLRRKAALGRSVHKQGHAPCKELTHSHASALGGADRKIENC